MKDLLKDLLMKDLLNDLLKDFGCNPFPSAPVVEFKPDRLVPSRTCSHGGRTG
jgi:hypothetical protein